MLFATKNVKLLIFIIRVKSFIIRPVIKACSFFYLFKMTRNYNSQLSVNSDVEKGLLLDERKNIDSSLFKNFGIPHQQLHSRSIRRLWNQLSRFQRFIICMLLFFVILCIIVLLPWTDSSSTNDFQSDSDKVAQQLGGFNLEDKNLIHPSVPFDKANDEETMPKLKLGMKRMVVLSDIRYTELLVLPDTDILH